MIRLFNYPQESFDFREEICAILGTEDLESLHKLGGSPVGLVKPGADNHTAWHNRFYDSVKDSSFAALYQRFLEEVCLSFYGEPLIVQAQPTFRIHWVGNLSVGAFHRDSDYNHNPAESNWWIPVTEAYGTNTIWIESAADRGDYHPWRVEPGQALIFPGSQLVHGNKVNDTKITRVSFDFRVIPASKYVEPENPGIGLSHGMRFAIGDYYKRLETLTSQHIHA